MSEKLPPIDEFGLLAQCLSDAEFLAGKPLPYLRREIRRALLAEREGCAKSCEHEAEMWAKEAARVQERYGDRNQQTVFRCELRQQTARALASRIRSRPLEDVS